MPRKTDIGKFLELARVAKSLTIEQASEKLGISRPTLTKYESGKVSVDTARDIFEKYGCNIHMSMWVDINAAVKVEIPFRDLKKVEIDE